MKSDQRPDVEGTRSHGQKTTVPVVLDQGLVVRFVAGEQAAFNEVFEQLKGTIFWQVQRFFKGAFDQEEALQEVWIKLYRMRDHFDVNNHEKFIPWVRTVARNQCIDLLKARGRHLETPMAEMEQACDPNQMVALSGERTRLALTHFVDQLDQGEQLFFQLCFIQELPHERIAERLSISLRHSKYLKKKLLARMLKSAPLREAREG